MMDTTIKTTTSVEYKGKTLFSVAHIGTTRKITVAVYDCTPEQLAALAIAAVEYLEMNGFTTQPIDHQAYLSNGLHIEPTRLEPLDAISTFFETKEPEAAA